MLAQAARCTIGFSQILTLSAICVAQGLSKGQFLQPVRLKQQDANLTNVQILIHSAICVEQGSSKGQFYREHLQPVRLNRQDVNWTAQNLSYLQPDAYNALTRETLAGECTLWRS